jgi:ankyrin repeat protein
MEGPLHEAVRRNDAARVAALLDGAGGARLGVDERDWMEQTALHCAAMGGRDALARALLAAGADPDAADESGCTPLHRRAVVQHALMPHALALTTGAANAGRRCAATLRWCRA